MQAGVGVGGWRVVGGGWWISVGAQEEAEPSRFKPLLRWANEQPTQATQAAQAMQTRPLGASGCRCDWLPARPFGIPIETTPAASVEREACPRLDLFQTPDAPAPPNVAALVRHVRHVRHGGAE